MSLIEMMVEGIGIDPSDSPLVLLRNAAQKVRLGIWIGPAEAIAIQVALDSTEKPRPLTHDLMATVLGQCDIQLERVTISRVEGSIYYASLHVQSANGAHEFDARPSDAIALALRMKAPILVNEEIVDHEEESPSEAA